MYQETGQQNHEPFNPRLFEESARLHVDDLARKKRGDWSRLDRHVDTLRTISGNDNVVRYLGRDENYMYHVHAEGMTMAWVLMDYEFNSMHRSTREAIFSQMFDGVEEFQYGKDENGERIPGRKTLVHMDIKTENILIDGLNDENAYSENVPVKVKLMDFENVSEVGEAPEFMPFTLYTAPPEAHLFVLNASTRETYESIDPTLWKGVDPFVRANVQSDIFMLGVAIAGILLQTRRCLLDLDDFQSGNGEAFNQHNYSLLLKAHIRL